jgi:hypothetical protein
MEQLTTQTAKSSAKVVYDDMVRNMDADDAPRNSRVVSNKRHNEQTKARSATGQSFRLNFADEVQTMCSMVATDDYVRCVTVTSMRVPSIILYSDRQIEDIKGMCFSLRSGSVLSFDKTFNLGKMYVTVSVYKNIALERVTTGQAPIFLGPIFLHGNSDFETFACFFAHLSARFVDSRFRELKIGSDEEASMRKAMKHSFPGARTIVCTRHLKDNMQRHAHKVYAL